MYSSSAYSGTSPSSKGKKRTNPREIVHVHRRIFVFIPYFLLCSSTRSLLLNSYATFQVRKWTVEDFRISLREIYSLRNNRVQKELKARPYPVDLSQDWNHTDNVSARIHISMWRARNGFLGISPRCSARTAAITRCQNWLTLGRMIDYVRGRVEYTAEQMLVLRNHSLLYDSLRSHIFSY